MTGWKIVGKKGRAFDQQMAIDLLQNLFATRGGAGRGKQGAAKTNNTSRAAGGRGAARPRKAEWLCGGGRTANFMDRCTCRRCGAEAPFPALPAAEAQPKAASQPAAESPPSDPSPKVVRERLAAAVEAAKLTGKAGLVAAAEAELATATAAAAAARPVGARVDSARAALRKAETKAGSADDAFLAAAARRTEAHAAVEQARQDLKKLEEELATAPPPPAVAAGPPDAVAAALGVAAELVAALEAGAGAGPLQERVAALKGALATASPAAGPAAQLAPAAPAAAPPGGTASASRPTRGRSLSQRTRSATRTPPPAAGGGRASAAAPAQAADAAAAGDGRSAQLRALSAEARALRTAAAAGDAEMPDPMGR